MPSFARHGGLSTAIEDVRRPALARHSIHSPGSATLSPCWRRGSRSVSLEWRSTSVRTELLLKSRRKASSRSCCAHGYKGSKSWSMGPRDQSLLTPEEEEELLEEPPPPQG